MWRSLTKNHFSYCFSNLYFIVSNLSKIWYILQLNLAARNFRALNLILSKLCDIVNWLLGQYFMNVLGCLQMYSPVLEYNLFYNDKPGDIRNVQLTFAYNRPSKTIDICSIVSELLEWKWCNQKKNYGYKN